MGHQIIRFEYRTETEKIKIGKLIRHYNRYYLPKRNKYKSRADSFRAKQTDTETPRHNWEKLIELEKKCDFPDLCIISKLISKFITSITNRKLRDKLLKEKELAVPKNELNNFNKIIRKKEQTGKRTLYRYYSRALISN